MYKESQFFSLFDKNSWNEGKSYNVIYKNGIQINKEKIYEIKETINLNKFSSLFKVTDFFPVDDGRIYYVDSENKLWEYNNYDNTFREMFFIETRGMMLHFKVVNEKVYTISKYEGKYCIKKFVLQTGQIINYRVLSEDIQGITMNNYGDIYALSKGDIIFIHRDGDKEKIISKRDRNLIDEIVHEENPNMLVMEVFKNKLLAIYNKKSERLYVLSLRNRDIRLVSKLHIVSLKSMCFNEKRELIINSEILGEWKLSIIKPPKYYLKYMIPKFSGPVESIRRHANGDMYLKSKYNIQYILRKTYEVSMKYDNTTHKGVYYSKVFDSMEKEMKWHKFVIDGNIPKDTGVKIKYYIFDNLNVYYKNGWSTIKDIVENEKINSVQKEEFFEKLWTGEIDNPKEALIQKGKGRYMFFKLELIGQKKNTPIIERIKIFFNRSSYLRYLPEIYQSNLDQNDFIERFMCIFESFYMNIEEKIDYISHYFDIDITPLPFLKWMCQWIGMEQYKEWEEEKLRKLLRRAAHLHRSRGTKDTIEEILEIYLEEKPIIVENFELEEVKKNKVLSGLVKQLYGNNPYNFTVLIKNGDKISDELYDGIYNILRNETPAYCEFNVILLKSWIFLDNYSYLGINSNVYGYTQLQLDGKGVIPYNSLLLDTVRERVMSGVTRVEVNTKLN